MNSRNSTELSLKSKVYFGGVFPSRPLLSFFPSFLPLFYRKAAHKIQLESVGTAISSQAVSRAEPGHKRILCINRAPGTHHSG